MEGPTPVSALIHAATMVTAGIFLVVRCSFLFELTPQILNIMGIVGIMTAFFGSITGLFLFDVKKIIAYSTCSQLGYMFFCCSLSHYSSSIYHLTTHAFFKALLFLTAGSIIHGMRGEQDIRRFGNLKKTMPVTTIVFFIGSLSLIGTPYLAGFYSKDLILEITAETITSLGNWVYLLAITATFFTAFYSTRLFYLIFVCTNNQTNLKKWNKNHESHKIILVPLMLLTVCSIFAGFFFEDIFLSPSSEFFKNAIFFHQKNNLIVELEYTTFLYKLTPAFFTVLGIICAIFIQKTSVNNILLFYSQS
jgi:NADH:ubiquinone oxidoreductase subunit 5 (subunit L)/multisubunit Na+/H+ antiporter MnhA subunit